MNWMAVLLWGEIRRRWRSAAAVGLMLGLGFAAVLAAAGGARRTDTAFPRMLEATKAPHIFVSGASVDGAERRRLYDGIADIDGVERVGLIVGGGFVPTGVPEGAGTEMAACSNLSLDGVALYDLGRPNVVEGRLPDPDSTDEILVSQSWADTFGVGVGDQVRLVRSPDGGPVGEVTAADGPVVSARIVGIGVLVTQVVPVSDLEDTPAIVAGPGFVARHTREQSEQCYDGAMVRLASDADIGTGLAEIDAMAQHAGGAFIQDLSGNYVEVRRAIQPQVTALWLFAVTVAGATLLVTGQILARQLRHPTVAAAPVWRALGLTRAQVGLLVAAPSVVTGLVGAGLAVAGAVLLSSRFPIGPAHLAETARGASVDFPIVAGGGLLVVASALVIGAATAVAAVSRRARRPAVGLLTRMSRAASQPALSLGIHLATDSGRGESRVPLRSAAAGVSLCLATMMATVTFARGLHDLVSEPARYGRDWDVMIDAVFGLVPVSRVLEDLHGNDSVGAVAGGRYGEVTIDGTPVPTVGLTDLVGTTFPALLEGRPPSRDDEIVMGRGSLRAIGRSVGDRVTVDTGTGPVEMTVVGSAAFPRLNHGSFSTLGLGIGAMGRTGAFPRRDPTEEPDLPIDLDPGDFLGSDDSAFEFVTIRLRDGATSEDQQAVLQAASRMREELRLPIAIRTEQRPTAIDNYAAVTSTPFILAALLGLMAAATLGHLLVSVGRRRRQDLALCAALGMTRAQVARAVVVQAVLVAGASVIVGVPLGITGGKLAWTGFASGLGVVDDLSLPLLAIALMVPGVLASAAGVAVVPALTASRTPPAVALRQGVRS